MLFYILALWLLCFFVAAQDSVTTVTVYSTQLVAECSTETVTETVCDTMTDITDTMTDDVGTTTDDSSSTDVSECT